MLWTDIRADDALPGLRRAMDWLRAHPGAALRLPAGIYRVSSPLARETMQAVMTGAYGENPENAMFAREFPYETGVAFDGQRDTSLLADGVVFLVEGFMEPVALRNCSNVCLTGLTIDYLRRPFSRATIEEVCRNGDGTGSFMARFAGGYPVDERTPMPRLCAYRSSPGRFDLSLRVRDRRYLGGNRMRFLCAAMPERLAGDDLYVWHCFHYRPAIRIENACNTTLRNVTIHSHCGMGVVGHRCENILLSGLCVVPAEGEHMSTNTDATHFTSCKGTIRFENCRFEGHGDDATNVHTFYHEFVQTGNRSARAWVKVRTHSATLDYMDPGDEVCLVDAHTLKPVDTLRVLDSEPDAAANCCRLAFDRALPGNADGYLLANITRSPRLEFVGCDVRNHWARAVLVKTREAFIENCRFENAALWAIHVAAEASWYEGIPSERVVICGNTFVNCGHAIRPGMPQTGGVNVEMDVRRHDGRQHRYVEITDNRFDLPERSHAVRVADTEEAVLRGNAYRTAGTPVVFENVGRTETDA